MIKEREQVMLYIPNNIEECIYLQELSFKYGYKWNGKSEVIELKNICLMFFRKNHRIMYGPSVYGTPINYCNHHGYSYRIMKDVDDLKTSIRELRNINYNEKKTLVYD